jgi:DNA-directed RNA polymerase subunit RPC12/RpoP
MPRLMREFQCTKCDKAFERFIDTNAEYVECDCGGVAYRMIGMPTVKLEGITGAFPGAAEKWARVREDNARIKARREQ